MCFPKNIFCILLVFIFLSLNLKAQTIGKNQPPTRSIEIQNLVNETYLVPAEFGIQALIRISKSNKITELTWKKELLLEAFRRLDEVQNPVLRKMVINGGSVDTRQNFLSMAFDQRLDALSLRSQILKEMLKVDKKKARELAFTNQFRLNIKSADCKDALDFDVSEFYETLAEIAKTSFTETEKQKQIRLLVLLPYIQEISSPVQLAPIAKLIISLDTTQVELNQFVLAYSSAFKTLQFSDRSFTNFLWTSQGFGTVSKLLDLVKKREIQTNLFIDSFRSFILKNFKAERCADNAGSYKIYSSGTIKWLNANLISNSPLTIEDLQSEKLGESAEIYNYSESTDMQDLSDKYKKLRFSEELDENEDNLLVSEEVKETQEWREQFDDFIADLNTWNGENEKTEMDFFHQKSVFYVVLFEIAPKGQLKTQTLQSFENFLSSHSSQKENRIEWFLEASRFIDLAKQNESLELLSNSKNTVIRLQFDLMKFGI